MIEVSWFKNIKDTTSKNACNVKGIFESIKNGGKNGDIKKNIEELRQYQDKKERNKRKAKLPVIMWQGLFSERRDTGIQSLSSLMCIDIDSLQEYELLNLKNRLITISWILAIFRSPSGDGLKVIVKTDNTITEHYKNCYRQLEKIFLDGFGIATDPNCEALSQGCYAGYDPDIYVNLNATDLHLEYNLSFEPHVNKTIYTPKVKYIPQTISPSNAFLNKLKGMANNVSDDKVMEILYHKFKRYSQNYEDGNRTKSIFLQASQLCKAGIMFEDAVKYLKITFLPTGYNEDKLEYEAERGYKKNENYFGSERGNYTNYSQYKKRRSSSH